MLAASIAVAACTHVLAIGNAGEVSKLLDCVPTRDVTQAELRALEAT